MPRLIRGDHLTNQQRQAILAGFPYRWTVENGERRYDGQCPACAQRAQFNPEEPTSFNGQSRHEYHRPLQSDDQWLAEHAFWLNQNGMPTAKRHAEEAYLGHTQ